MTSVQYQKLEKLQKGIDKAETDLIEAKQQYWETYTDYNAYEPAQMKKLEKVQKAKEKLIEAKQKYYENYSDEVASEYDPKEGAKVKKITHKKKLAQAEKNYLKK